MIKRLVFVTLADRSEPVDRAEWISAASRVLSAPPEDRPVRVVVCTSLVSLRDPRPRHDGVVITWFDDPAHLDRFSEFSESSEGRRLLGRFDGRVDAAASPVVVAEEHALRGADWLEHRWTRGGTAYKHMALARRAEGLSAEEFSARWRAHAGRVGGPSASTGVPEDVRGLAYVQNHPLPRPDGWAYDAVNEVWFDDLAGLQHRSDWFRRRDATVRADPLFSESWFLAVREDVVEPLPGSARAVGP